MNWIPYKEASIHWILSPISYSKKDPTMNLIEHNEAPLEQFHDQSRDSILNSTKRYKLAHFITTIK